MFDLHTLLSFRLKRQAVTLKGGHSFDLRDSVELTFRRLNERKVLRNEQLLIIEIMVVYIYFKVSSHSKVIKQDLNYEYFCHSIIICFILFVQVFWIFYLQSKSVVALKNEFEVSFRHSLALLGSLNSNYSSSLLLMILLMLLVLGFSQENLNQILR